MSCRRDLLVVGEASSLVLQVLLALHAAGDARCAVRSRVGARVLRFSPLCRDYGELDFGGADDARFAAEVNRLARAWPDLVLVPADCGGARLVGRVLPQLHARSIPAPDAQMLDALEDKWSFFHFCRAHGLPVPTTRWARTKAELPYAATAEALGLPFVVKPANRFGASGVLLIHGERDFRERILDQPAYQHAPLVAQRYVRGEDVGVNLLALHGHIVALALQRRVGVSRCGDGAPVHFFAHPGLERAAHALVQASVYHGVMNLDARLEEGSGAVVLLESNPRFWRSLLASVWCGLNFAAESLAPGNTLRQLSAGSAETYFHPLFCPSLWGHALRDTGPQGRLLRHMAVDPCVLADSVRAKLRVRLGRDPLALASASAPQPPLAAPPAPACEVAAP